MERICLVPARALGDARLKDRHLLALLSLSAGGDPDPKTVTELEAWGYVRREGTTARVLLDPPAAPDAQPALFPLPAPEPKQRGWASLPDNTKAAITRVLDHWAERFGMRTTGGGRHTPKRRSCVHARLENFSEADLIAALNAAHQDPFILEHPQYWDITSLLRNDERVERRLAQARNPKADRKHREAAATDAPITVERL